MATLPVFLVGGLASLMRTDLHFDAAVLGLVVGAFYGASALTSIPGGHLAERLGPARSLLVGTALATTSLAAIGLLVRSWPQLAALLVLAGISNGIIQPAANLALARGVPDGLRGVAFGVKQSAVPISTLMAGVAVPVIGLTVGWRWAFAGAALWVIPLLAALPRSVPAGAGASVRPRVRIARGRLPSLLRISLAACCGAVAANSMGAFYVESAVSRGQAMATAGLLLSCGSIAGILTRLTMGVVADRTTVDPVRIAGTMMCAGTVGLFSFGHTTGTVLLAAGTLLGYAAGWGWPGLLHLAVVNDHAGAPGAASGVMQAGTLCGGLLGPIGFGRLALVDGYPTAWTAVAVVALFGGALLLWERHHEPARAR